MITPPRIDALDLLDEVNGLLLHLLRSLDPDEWHKPTMCSAWDVKDIAAHLLDTSLRRLSLHRDGYASWTGEDESRNWAAEEESRNWFDIAGEHTERWHHTQQLFEAVGRPSPLPSRRLYHPVLETFLRALPFAFRDADRPEGTAVRVVVRGEAGGEWWLVRQGGCWKQVVSAGEPAASVTLPQEVAWKVWTKRRPVEDKLRSWPGILVEGDAELGGLVVCMVAVMA